MRLKTFAWAVLVGLVTLEATAADEAPAAPKFRVQEIDKSLTVGYGVILVDVNGDKKKDVVVADSARVVWWENPSWKMRTIVQGKTKPDNVCLDAHDIDGDGKLDIALGAGWKPSDTNNPGTLQWLRQGGDIEKEWELIPIENQEPTVHRIRFADADGDGKAELVSVPLHGRGAKQDQNFAGAGVRVLAFEIPGDPKQSKWESWLISDSLPVMHNFQVVDFDGDGKNEVLTASYEGVHVHTRGGDGKWTAKKIGDGDQANPRRSRGASEIKLGKLPNGRKYVATIEPWHGNQVVVYVQAEGDQWQRRPIDNALAWGHAVWTANLDGAEGDELIIGVRDPVAGGKALPGVRVYKATSPTGVTWHKTEIDPDGVHVEDAAAADLNGDGRVDIVAVGRKTKNVRIYWNEGK